LKDGRKVQLGTGPEILARPADDYVADFVSDVDRSRVLTAEDVLREPRIVAHMDERPADVLQRLGVVEANAAYVVDSDNRILGVVRDEVLASAATSGRSEIAPDDLVEGYRTTEKDRPLIDLVDLVGRQLVPLAVVDDQKRLLGVVPRAAVLGALATPSRT
jgi:glycine betaine/proline transport system ATP-binding protein